MGNKKADLVGLRSRPWGRDSIVAVELKNDVDVFEDATSQISNYTLFADEVYLACTPHMAVEYLRRHASMTPKGVVRRRWDPTIFDHKLRGLGCGLLLVVGEEVQLILKPEPTRSPEEHRVRDVFQECERRRALAGGQRGGE